MHILYTSRTAIYSVIPITIPDGGMPGSMYNIIIVQVTEYHGNANSEAIHSVYTEAHY